MKTRRKPKNTSQETQKVNIIIPGLFRKLHEEVLVKVFFLYDHKIVHLFMNSLHDMLIITDNYVSPFCTVPCISIKFVTFLCICSFRFFFLSFSLEFSYLKQLLFGSLSSHGTSKNLLSFSFLFQLAFSVLHLFWELLKQLCSPW